MAGEGTNWQTAAGAPSGPLTTVMSRPVSRWSKIRPSIMENPRSWSPRRLRPMSSISWAADCSSSSVGSTIRTVYPLRRTRPTAWRRPFIRPPSSEKVVTSTTASSPM